MGLEETLLVSLEEGETNHRGLILYWERSNLKVSGI